MVNVTADVTVPARIVRVNLNALQDRGTEVAGWGTIHTGTIRSRLHVVDVNILTNQVCSRRYRHITGNDMVIPNNYYCTAANPVAFVYPVSIHTSTVMITLTIF
jgi:glutamine phosphoribosylpyrophosphate amidotransferase